jgi:hypothetical protein
VEEAGAGNVTGLILLGSFASREGSVAIAGGAPVFLSDIDLLLVVSGREAHEKLYTQRTRIAADCEDLLPGAIFDGRIDLGVMTRDELPAMPHSPGVFDIKKSGMVLHGDESLKSLLPSFPPDAIGAREALRLLENRMAAFLGYLPLDDGGGEIERLRFLYGISKVYTDIITGTMSAHGKYMSGYAERAGHEGLENMLGAGPAETAARWTRFKIDPTGEQPPLDVDREKEWLAAAGDLLAARDRVRGMTDGDSKDRPPSVDLYRAWRNTVTGIPMALRLAAAGARPGEHLRREAVRLIRHAVGKGITGNVGSSPGGYPHRKTTWKRAAGLTCSAWKRFVTGREEGDE